MRHRARRGPRDQGQASVELALLLPVLALVALALIQVGLLVRAQLLVTHAAREGARAAAVDEHPDAARTAAVASTPLDPGRLEVHASGRAGPGSRVRVEVRYRAPLDVPLVGAFIDDRTLTAAATMRVE